MNKATCAYEGLASQLGTGVVAYCENLVADAIRTNSVARILSEFSTFERHFRSLQKAVERLGTVHGKCRQWDSASEYLLEAQDWKSVLEELSEYGERNDVDGLRELFTTSALSYQML